MLRYADATPRLPHDCHTTATANLHIKWHIAHPRDQACHMICNAQTSLPDMIHFLDFLLWQSCGSRASCIPNVCYFAVAVVWQLCGSRADIIFCRIKFPSSRRGSMLLVPRCREEVCIRKSSSRDWFHGFFREASLIRNSRISSSPVRF